MASPPLGGHLSGRGVGIRRRTPRPPPVLGALSLSSSMPAASSAPTSFIRESTLPRTTPSLASMRWLVGSDRPARSASLRWSSEEHTSEPQSLMRISYAAFYLKKKHPNHNTDRE